MRKTYTSDATLVELGVSHGNHTHGRRAQKGSAFIRHQVIARASRPWEVGI